MIINLVTVESDVYTICLTQINEGKAVILLKELLLLPNPKFKAHQKNR
jgi:hypothetical protein